MLRKQIRSVAMLILTAILILPLFTMTVSAAYENTYTNTGNMRDDIIGVALTQVGYEEGSDNYTKYGVWYGQPNSPWCGMFVSWCAKEAEIPTSILKRTGIANPENFGLSYVDGSEYTPLKGDLFFKKNFGHVGLVYYTEGDYFYTIEGNTNVSSSDPGSVMIRKRKISDFYFSSPNYSGSSSSCDHSYSVKTESAHPHKEYKICEKCGKKSYTGETITDKTCKTCIQDACTHVYGDWKKSSETRHSRICTKCDYVQSAPHNWSEETVIKEATCMGNGICQVICEDCGAESSKTIPSTGEHSYGNFAYLDESLHQKVCAGCDEQTTSQHTISDTWCYDSIYHWTSCEDCGGFICHTEHRFTDGCLEPCADCGYTLPNGHRSNGEIISDDIHHWEVCTRCEEVFNETVHVYSSECDEICNQCGYQRSGTTAHQDVYQADASGHWRRCTSCNRVTDAEPHSPSRNTEDWDALLCTHCGYELRSDDQHEHTLAEIHSDAESHWGTCLCGEEIAAEVHVWDFQTGLCSICGASNPAANAETHLSFWVIIWNFLFGK